MPKSSQSQNNRTRPFLGACGRLSSVHESRGGETDARAQEDKNDTPDGGQRGPNRQQLSLLVAQLWRDAAQASAAGHLPPAAMRRLKALLKAAGRTRWASAARVRWVVGELAAMSAELAHTHVEAPSSKPATPQSPDEEHSNRFGAAGDSTPTRQPTMLLSLVPAASPDGASTDAGRAARASDGASRPMRPASPSVVLVHSPSTAPAVETAAKFSGANVAGKNIVSVRRHEDSLGRRRRPLVSRAFDAQSGAAFLRALDAGEVSWEQALRPTARETGRSFAEMLNDPEIAKEVADRIRLIDAMKTLNPAQAWEKVFGAPPTQAELHRAYRVRTSAAKAPRALLVDKRRLRSTVAPVMVPLVQALTIVYYFARTAASRDGIAEEVNKALALRETKARAAGVTLPFPVVTRASVTRFLHGLPNPMKVGRAKGMEEVVRQLPVVLPDAEATAPHVLIEIDHTRLRTWVLLPTGKAAGQWKIARLWVTSAICAYSGLPLAIHISSRTPDAFSTSLVLHQAITPHYVAGYEVGGIPRIVRHDRGSDFQSQHVAQVAIALGMQLLEGPPRTPNFKPHIERFFRTLKKSLARLPGNVADVGKTREAAMKHVATFMSAERLMEHVRELTERLAGRRIKGMSESRIARYSAKHRPRYPATMEDLDLLLMKSDRTAKLARGAVHFRGETYQLRDGEPMAGRLLELHGERVQIRYHPDVLDAVYVYRVSTGERIGEFVLRQLAPLALTARAANDQLPSLSFLIRDAIEYVREGDRSMSAADLHRATEARIAKVNGLATLEGHPSLRLKQQIPEDADVVSIESVQGRSKRGRKQTARAVELIAARGAAIPEQGVTLANAMASDTSRASLDDYFDMLDG